jgi:hypothetical protein
MFNPSLPDGYSLGAFYILDLGIFCVPRPVDTVFFSGLQRHGGSPPRAPPGMNVATDAYRFTVVAYPNSYTARGLGPVALAPLGAGDDLLTIGPEIRHRLSSV